VSAPPSIHHRLNKPSPSSPSSSEFQEANNFPLPLFSLLPVILSSDDGSRIFTKYYTPPHHGGNPSAAGSGMAHLSSFKRIHTSPLRAPLAKQTTLKTAPTSTASQNPYPDKTSQTRFEKGLLAKTAKQNGDILLYDNRVVLYKMESDVAIYVVGSTEENEVLLYNVLLALRDGLHLLFKSVFFCSPLVSPPLLADNTPIESRG